MLHRSQPQAVGQLEYRAAPLDALEWLGDIRDGRPLATFIAEPFHSAIEVVIAAEEQRPGFAMQLSSCCLLCAAHHEDGGQTNHCSFFEIKAHQDLSRCGDLERSD